MAPSLTPDELGTVLSVWAHPDDETYLSGGLMAAAAANGQRVTCVSATAGEHGTDDPHTWPPERLGRLRRWEAAAAMAVLGVDDHRFLDYADGELAGLDPAEPVARVASLIDEVRPDTILTFGPDGVTFHSDHQTVSTWTTEAWRSAGRPGRLLHFAEPASFLEIWGPRFEEWGIYMTDERPTGVPDGELAINHELEGPALDQKMAALCAMHTQTAAAVQMLGLDVYRAQAAWEFYVAVEE